MYADVPMPHGFVLFSTPATAQAALQLLNGRLFDTGCFLRCEWARGNLYVKDDDPTIRRANYPLPARQPRADPLAEALAALSVQVPASGPATNTDLASALMAAPYDALGSTAAAAAAAAAGSAGASGSGSGAGLVPPLVRAALLGAQQLGLVIPPAFPNFGVNPNKNDNPPCSTLFIGNLSESVNEKELRMLFASIPGFRQMKLAQDPRGVICFVEFRDLESAAAVHSALQGAVVPSSTRGPIRVQYSRNEFGKRSMAPAPAAVPTQPGFANVGAAAAAAAPSALSFGAAPLAFQQLAPSHQLSSRTAAALSALGVSGSLLPGGSLASALAGARTTGELAPWVAAQLPQQYLPF
ncbi:hypothetical protein GPECTOR_60g767 [Gonium pectorale]|uniref:RRM domain-containing protein n=1 Tax=Gonium pectorale TaxID=33097 RepID=A0A150G597_GONPE|nr:hypothetical protein GPECTOR_60g767 [Gonium pectorale]|eukprot:KXZ44988.1 hypothetical protein GPECTOR_60g767 [Gonium pectorale]